MIMRPFGSTLYNKIEKESLFLGTSNYHSTQGFQCRATENTCTAQRTNVYADND